MSIESTLVVAVMITTCLGMCLLQYVRVSEVRLPTWESSPPRRRDSGYHHAFTVNSQPQKKSQFHLPAGQWEIVVNSNEDSK